MKDLYTFDVSEKEALETYQIVRDAYNAFFDELKIPYLIAKAHSGDIGGETSHEYHFPNAKGEDVIVSCSKCAYLINEELESDRWLLTQNVAFTAAITRDSAKRHTEGLKLPGDGEDAKDEYIGRPGDAYDENVVSQGFKIWHGVTADRSVLVEAVIPKTMKVLNPSGSINHWRRTEICTNSIKRAYPDIDLSVQRPIEAFEQHGSGRNAAVDVDGYPTTDHSVHTLCDQRVSRQARKRWAESSESIIPRLEGDVNIKESISAEGIVKMAAGDPCPNCGEGAVKKTKAIELGHTFHLGTRYSEPLDACFAPSVSQRTMEATAATVHAANPAENPELPHTDTSQSLTSTSASQTSNKVPMQMGCHGIGISRMIAAVADTLADSKGLNWPRVIAPFEVVIINKDEHQNQVPIVYNLLNAATQTPALASHVSMEAPLDIIVDDRKQSLVWKLNDADLIGYPVIVVLGKRYGKERICEVQCRRLGVKEDVHIDALNRRVRGLLEQL